MTKDKVILYLSNYGDLHETQHDIDSFFNFLVKKNAVEPTDDLYKEWMITSS